jgi:hypothetical protein
VRWFFGLNHPIWYSKYESKFFLIRFIIYGDIHAFSAYITS